MAAARLGPVVRDRTALVAVCVALVGWSAARLAAGPSVVPTALVVGFVALAIGSVPAVVVAELVYRRRRLPPLDGPVAAGLLAVLVGWTVVEVALPRYAGYATLVGVLVGLVAFAAVLPLAVGALVAERAGVGVRVVRLAWPVSLVVGAVGFLAPGADGLDLARYNATFLDEPWRSLVLGAVAAVVVLGPAATAAVLGARR